MGSRRLYYSNIKVFFFGCFLLWTLFVTPKFMIIRWCLLFFGSFARHLENHLSTCGSNLNFTLISMSDIEFFSLDGGLDSIFQHCGPCKFFWNNSKISYSNHSSHIEDDIMKSHEQKKKWKKVKNQDFMSKTNFFLSTLPFNPWVVSTTWLHVELLRLMWIKTHFEQNFTTGSYGVGIWRVWCSQKACEICSSLVQKKKLKKIIFLYTNYPNCNRPIFGLKEF
jgi:hypothetical protein